MLSVTQENLNSPKYSAKTILQHAAVLHQQQKTNKIWQVGPNIPEYFMKQIHISFTSEQNATHQP